MAETITLHLQPETERGLIAQAQSKGLSLTEHARAILAAAGAPAASSVSIRRAAPEATNLYDLFASVRGLLTDDEVDRYFRRNTESPLPGTAIPSPELSMTPLPVDLTPEEWGQELDDFLDSLPAASPLPSNAFDRDNIYGREDNW